MTVGNSCANRVQLTELDEDAVEVRPLRVEGAEVEGSEKVDVDYDLPEVSVFGRDGFKRRCSP